MPNPGHHLGAGLGCRDPEHLRRWRAALEAGRQRALKCDATKRDGRHCQALAMKGATRCCHHLHGPERDALDLARLPRLRRDLVAGNYITKARAARAIARIDRRQLHRIWRHSPDVPGSTLTLVPPDERRVREWLRGHGIDLDRDDHGLTFRAIDRVRWAGFLRLIGRLDDTGAKRRILLAKRDDERWITRQQHAASGQ